MNKQMKIEQRKTIDILHHCSSDVNVSEFDDMHHQIVIVFFVTLTRKIVSEFYGHGFIFQIKIQFSIQNTMKHDS